MDSTPPKPEVSQESARESLIAISQSIPEESFTKDFVPAKSADANGSGFNEHLGIGADYFRSKLISISDAPSPEAQPLPPTLENPAS